MYKIIGADGKEYGPISADQVRRWIAEGRANAATKVLPEGATEWVTVAQIPELAAAQPAAAPFPSTPTYHAMPGVASPQSMLNGPGIGLIVTGAFYLLLGIWRLVSPLLFSGLAASFGDNDPELQKMLAMSGPFNMILSLVTFIFAGIVLWGGINMRRVESYGLCMTAAIIAIVPCTFPCCLLGMPFGIWALVVLAKAEVKQAFT